MIQVPIWVIVLGCIAVALLLYISFVQYRRAEKSLQAANMLASNMSTIYSFIQQATEKMENPKLKQAFEADDEVGFFFQQLEDIQSTLATFVPHEETVTDVE